MRRVLHQTTKIARRILPGHIVRHQRTRSVVQRLADSLGLVYFGYVDQRDDEHRLVRGITVSTTHDDHHYTVGSFQGYDISLVIRRDSLQYSDRRLKEHFWTILTVDLHSEVDLPHMYVGQHTARDEMVARLTQLTALPHAGDAFSKQYTLYGSMGQFIMIQSLFMQPVREVIAREFAGASIEIADGTVYLYLPEKHPSRTQLERLVRNGIWLAQTIDSTLYSPTA